MRMLRDMTVKMLKILQCPRNKSLARYNRPFFHIRRKNPKLGGLFHSKNLSALKVTCASMQRSSQVQAKMFFINGVWEWLVLTSQVHQTKIFKVPSRKLWVNWRKFSKSSKSNRANILRRNIYSWVRSKMRLTCKLTYKKWARQEAMILYDCLDLCFQNSKLLMLVLFNFNV